MAFLSLNYKILVRLMHYINILLSMCLWLLIYHDFCEQKRRQSVLASDEWKILMHDAQKYSEILYFFIIVNISVEACISE